MRRPYFQTESHSEVLGVTTSRNLGEHTSVHNIISDMQMRKVAGRAGQSSQTNTHTQKEISNHLKLKERTRWLLGWWTGGSRERNKEQA